MTFSFIRERKFHRLFNVLLPVHHPSYQTFGVPEHYTPLNPSMAMHTDTGILSPNNSRSAEVMVASSGNGVFASWYQVLTLI